MRQTNAAALAGSAVIAAQLTGARHNPSPSHPRTAAWYEALRKPSFTPPAPVFGVAWTGLDVLLGYAGYRLLSAPPSHRRRVALGAWALNLFGIAGFSWILFGRKRLDEALEVTAAMVVTATATCVTAAAVDRRAGNACLPLLGWVIFAAVLQEEVWRRNR